VRNLLKFLSKHEDEYAPKLLEKKHRTGIVLMISETANGAIKNNLRNKSQTSFK